MTITKPDGTLYHILLTPMSTNYELQQVKLNDNSYIEIEHYNKPEIWHVSWNQAIPNSDDIEVLDAISAMTKNEIIDWINNLLTVIPAQICN